MTFRYEDSQLDFDDWVKENYPHVYQEWETAACLFVVDLYNYIWQEYPTVIGEWRLYDKGLSI